VAILYAFALLLAFSVLLILVGAALSVFSPRFRYALLGDQADQFEPPATHAESVQTP